MQSRVARVVMGPLSAEIKHTLQVQMEKLQAAATEKKRQEDDPGKKNYLLKFMK